MLRPRGAEVSVFGPADFTADKVNAFDAIAFGCPAMGAEVLEETEFEPMFESVEGSLKDRKIALFGSWGWGDGAYMADWESRCADDGAILAHTSVLAQDAPDDDALAECRDLGAALA